MSTYEFTQHSTGDLNYRMFICTIDYLNCFHKTINVSMYQCLHTAVFQDLFVICTSTYVGFLICNTNKVNIDMGV